MILVREIVPPNILKIINYYALRGKKKGPLRILNTADTKSPGSTLVGANVKRKLTWKYNEGKHLAGQEKAKRTTHSHLKEACTQFH